MVISWLEARTVLKERYRERSQPRMVISWLEARTVLKERHRE